MLTTLVLTISYSDRESERIHIECGQELLLIWTVQVTPHHLRLQDIATTVTK